MENRCRWDSLSLLEKGSPASIANLVMLGEETIKAERAGWIGAGPKDDKDKGGEEEGGEDKDRKA